MASSSVTRRDDLFVNKMYETLTRPETREIRGKNIRTLVIQGIFDKVVNPQIVETGKSATTSSSSPTGSVWS